MTVRGRATTRQALRVRRGVCARFWRRKKTVPRGVAPDAENARDLPRSVDSSRAGSLRIGIVEREELAWRGHPSQAHRPCEHKTMVWEIRCILPDHVPEIVDLVRVGKVRRRKVKVVELPVRRSNKAVVIPFGVSKKATDKIPGVDGKRRGLHRSRRGVLKRSENAARVNKGNVGGWIPQ